MLQITINLLLTDNPNFTKRMKMTLQTKHMKILTTPYTPRDLAGVIRVVSVGDRTLDKALTETGTIRWETLVHADTATPPATYSSTVLTHPHTGKKTGMVTVDSTVALVMIAAVEHVVQEATTNSDMRLHNQLKVVML